jgi:hypothetical protein
MKTRPRRKPSRPTARWPQACLISALGGLAAITAFSGAHAQPRHDGPEHHDARFGSPHWVLDSRFHHDRYYPSRGYRVAALPGGSMAVRFGADRLFFQAGVWFRPVGREFVVVTPPFGVVVPALPPGCATLWLGSSSYYYANGVYYANAVGTPGYVVATTVQPPAPAAPAPPVPARDDLAAYPRNGQSQAQMFSDRADCARWATSQSGYEPAPAGSSADPALQDAYRRAESACLDGRGYTVR